MANQFFAGNVMVPQTYVDNLDKAIELLWMRRDQFSGNLEQFFTKVQTDSLSYKTSSVSSVADAPVQNEDTDDLPYSVPAPGFDKTFTLVSYRMGIRVTDTMVKADRFGKIVSMTGGLMKATMRRIENLRAAILNGAFATTTTPDAAYLCSNSHLHENPEAGTYDNLGSGALTYGNLQSLRLLGMNMENEKGDPDSVVIQTLLVPTALQQKAEELVTATLNPENALNQPVTLIKNLKIVVSPFLTSTTAYFGFGDLQGEDKGLLEMYLEEPNIADNSPENADIVIDKRVKFIAKMGAIAAKNVYGATGT